MRLYSLIFLLFSIPLSVFSQQKIQSDSRDTLNEIKVLSRKKTIQWNNPLPIVHISEQTIAHTVSSNIIDVLVVNTPGLRAVKTGPNISKPFIRGLGYNQVLTLYDGIRQEGQQWGDEHGIEVDGYHIDHVEIIKGPASILYGSDALAGVISLHSKMPVNQVNKWEINTISEYQTNNNLIGNGVFLGYKKNRFAMSFDGSYKLAKNYRNKVDGRIYNTNFKEANASMHLGYWLNKGYISFNATWYHNLQGIPDGSRDSLTRQFTKQIAEGEEDNINGRPLVSERELNGYFLSPLHQSIRHYRMYTALKKDWEKSTLQTTIAFQQNNRTEYSHPTIINQPGMDVRLQTYSYDVLWNFFSFMPNTKLSIGSNGMYQTNSNVNATDFPIPDYQLYESGLFPYAKWTKNNWVVTAGVRGDRRHVQWDDFYIANNPLTGMDQRSTKETQSSTLQFNSFSKNFGGLSGSVGAVYIGNQHWKFKANVARGYRVPNITELASNGLDPGAHIIYLGNRTFQPEFSLQQDIGVHMQQEDIDLEASLFTNHIANYIYLSMVTMADGNAIIDPQGNKTYQYQQSKAHLYGAEASFFVHPKAWKNMVWNTSFSTVYGFNNSDIYQHKGTQGAYLPLIPPLNIATNIHWTIFQYPKGWMQSFACQYDLEYNAQQDRYLGLNNTETRTPDYALHNITFYMDFKLGSKNKVTCIVAGQNIFDKVYQSNMSRLKYLEYYASSPNGKSGIYNMGRNISIKLLYSF